MNNWIEYTGSDSQLDEMEAASKGYILRVGTNKAMPGNMQTSILYGKEWEGWKGNIHSYFLCNPPLFAFVIPWLMTGQPVWWRSKASGGTGQCHEFFLPFAYPNEFEYSFTEFKESGE